MWERWPHVSYHLMSIQAMCVLLRDEMLDDDYPVGDILVCVVPGASRRM